MSQMDFEPEVFKKAKTWLTIADYFNYRFSGKPVLDTSMASTTQMMNVRTRNWSDTIMTRFGISREQWPVIVRPGRLLGPCVDMPRVHVVASCSHDTGAAVAAVPADEAGPPWAYISCGTWSLLGVELAEPILSGRARDSGFTNEAGIDETVRFLKNLSGLWALQECVREWRENGEDIDYETLIDEARDARHLNGHVDLELDRFYERGDMESRLRTYCREEGITEPTTRGELVRLILESIADSFARSLTDLDEITGTHHEVVHIVGGGSQNDLLCQLAATASRRKVVAGPSEATALGNLAIQARTMGDLRGGPSIRELIRNSTDLNVYQPGPTDPASPSATPRRDPT
jgi:rhamnulokinase